MKWRLLILTLLLVPSLWALDVKIRLFSTDNLTSATIIPDTGSYYLIALDEKLRPIDTILDVFSEEQNRKLSITRYGKDVQAKKGDDNLGVYKAVLIRSKHPEKEFRIYAAGKWRVYHGDLQLRIYDTYLQVVNIVDLEDYVAGVVESEGGHELNPEYFKAQAVLARTFVLRNWNKHLRDGYNLKDDVTSQVYFSKAHYRYSAAIMDAVDCTKDTVVVTYNCEPILGVFHANSGGYTVGSDHAWSNSIEYLKPQRDTFSLNVGSYNWEKTVSKAEFYGYVASKLGVANDIHLHKAWLNFDQRNGRVAYFEYKGKKLKLTSLRSKFRLRSTYFTVHESGSDLILKGNGYGHGVGLSQDGAMEMDKRGYNYRDILQFYFSGVELECIEHLGDS